MQKCLFVWPFISTLHIHEFPVRMRKKSSRALLELRVCVCVCGDGRYTVVSKVIALTPPVS